MPEKVKLTDLLANKNAAAPTGPVKLTDILAAQKKSPVQNVVTETVVEKPISPDLEPPVSQPIQPSKQNGTVNLPPITLGAESLSAGQTTTDATAQTAVSKPVGFETKEQRRQAIGQKSNEHSVARADAILNYNTYESNIKDPKVKELEVLHNRLREAEEGRGIGEDAQYLKTQIELLGSQAVEPKLSALDQFGQPISKKAPYKTYGEMYEATKKSQNLSQAQKETADKLQAELTPAIEAERKKENFQVDYTDENGNEYYKMNPMESFINGISGSVDVLDIGLQNISGNKPAALNAMKNKYVADNILFPKGTGDISATPSGALNAFGKLTEMGGGVVPLVAAGAVAGSTGPLGVAAANALLFGAQDYGGTLYQAYSEEKTKNPDITDEEAMQLAESNAKFAGAKGAVLGGSMGLQGALGKSLFLNKAETSAFKTFMAEQSVMLPAFGTSTALQNLYEDKPVGEGVGQSMIDALIIGGMTHAVGAGMKMTSKLRGTFENAIAKNYGKLATTINDAVEAGTMDFATANSIAERAKAFDIVGKENPPKAEAKLVDLGIALNDVAQKAEEVKKVNPLADTGELEAEAERINREIAETKGSPLSEKEQKEYEKLIEKRDKPATEGGEKPSLLQSEKDKIKHFEARIERAGKNEANSVAEGLGYDHAKHLLNDIEAKGLGKFETVQDVPKKVLEELKKANGIEAKKADIERRRKEELKKNEDSNSQEYKDLLKQIQASNENYVSPESNVFGLTGAKENVIDVIKSKIAQSENGFVITKLRQDVNAKYDAELAALETPTVTEPKPFTRERQPQEVGETETIEAKQTETVEVVQEPKITSPEIDAKKKALQTKKVVAEINSLPITHAKGVGMGANEMEGTYLSTEKENRYAAGAKEVVKVKPNVENPYVLRDAGELIDLQNAALQKAKEAYLNDNPELAKSKMFKEFQEAKTFDADILSSLPDFQGYVAKEVTKNLKAQGHDSVYLRESKNDEGMLIVFDRDNTKLVSAKKFVRENKKKSAKRAGNIDALRKGKEWKEKMKDFSPSNIADFISNYFAKGGKINTEDLVTETGFGTKKNQRISAKGNETYTRKGAEEFNKREWMHDAKAPKMDRLAMELAEGWKNDHGGDVVGGTEAIRNEIIDFIRNNDNKDAVRKRLLEAQEEAKFIEDNGGDRRMLERAKELEKADAQDIAAMEVDETVAETVVDEVEAIELDEKDIASLNKFLDTFTGQDGNVDWAKVKESVEDVYNDAYTSLTTKAAERLNKIIENGNTETNGQRETTAKDNGTIEAAEKAGQSEAEKIIRDSYAQKLADADAKIEAAKQAKKSDVNAINKRANLFGGDSGAEKNKGLFGAQKDDYAQIDKVVAGHDNKIAEAEASKQKLLNEQDKAITNAIDIEKRQQSLDLKDSGNALDSIEAAKEKLADAINKAKNIRDNNANNLGVRKDPFDEAKRQAKADREVFDAYVDLAKEYIKYGVKNVEQFAKELGEEITDTVRKAWDEAYGEKKNRQAEEVAPNQDPNWRFVDEETTTETEQADGVEKTLVTKRAYKGTFREEVKRALEEIGLTRDIENQAEVDAKTDQFIKEVGMDAALESVRNFVVKGAAAAAILGKRIDAIDKELKDTENFDKFTELVQEQAAILEELGQLNLDAGRLNAYMNRIYQNSDAGYKTAIQKNRWEKAFGEEPPKEIMEAWQERDKQIADLTERVKRLEEEQATKEAQDAVNEIKESVGREKTRKTRSKKADDLIAEGLDELVTALGGKKMAMGDRSPQVSKALEKIGRGLIEKGIATIENVAEKVREYVEEKYPNKLNFADYEEGFADNIAAAMAEETTTGKVKISKNLIRRLVGEGITDVNELVKAVKEQVADKYPDATDREIRDAITGYGKTSNPNKEEIEAKVRKLKNLGRVISGLEDVAEGKRPLKSGFQRDKPDVEVRAAQKELREAMKDLPIDAKTLEGHLKTALDSIKQRLSNQIEDFNREIKTGEETPKNERTVEYDEDANWLKEERDRVKAIRDEIFGKSELTDEQRIDIATKALEKSIERKKEMLGSGDIMPKPKASKTPETPELKRLRTENEILQDEINALRKKQKDAENPPKTKEQIATENAIEANKKSIEEKERRIRENDLAPKPSKEVADKNNAELKSLRTKNGLLDKQLQKLRNDAKQKRSAEEIATENKIKALERKAADIQDKIKKGELEAVKKESKVDKTNPKYIAAKNKAEAALEELKKLQKVAGIPEKRRLDLTKKATERRIAELKKKLADGDFTKKTRKPLIADTELIRAKAEKLRLQEEYDKEFYKHELENRADWQKAKDGVADAWGLARVLSATGEASFVGIQGLVQTIAHPIYAAEAFKNATKFLFSEKKTEEWLRRLKQQEFYPVMKEAKLALTEPSAKITAREELYNSGWTDLAWNMLVSPAKLRSKSAYEAWKKGNPIRAIERASVGYLDTLRVMRFLDGMEILEAKGKHIAKDKEDYKDLADMINTLTGRASLGFAEQIAEPMSKVLFSPRNWASQVKTATPYALYHFGKMTPTARKMAVQDFSKFVGLTTGMVMMAAAGLNNDDDPETGVEFDPRSSDFMKIRLGKKRVDPWGGRIQQIVFTSRLFMDFLHDVAPKLSDGGMKTGSGDIVPLGTPYKAKTKEGVAIQMAINKLAPSASLMEKYIASHKNKNDVRVDEYGKELDLWKSAKESMRPIFWGTVNDLLKDDPGALNGLLGFAAFFGYGVNVYGDKGSSGSSSSTSTGTTQKAPYIPAQRLAPLPKPIPLMPK